MLPYYTNNWTIQTEPFLSLVLGPKTSNTTTQTRQGVACYQSHSCWITASSIA